MITTSHAVQNALAAQRANGRPAGLLADASTRRAFIVGGIAPDIALYVLSAAALVYYPLVDGRGFRDAHQFAMDDLFFNSPWWIPGLLAITVAGGIWFAARWSQRRRTR